MSIYRLESRKASDELIKSGTAWQLGADLIVTALHVVGDQGRWYREVFAGATYHLFDAGKELAVSLQPLAHDSTADIAVLKSSSPLPHPGLVLSASDPIDDARWSVDGFPSVTGEKVFRLNGLVAAVRAQGAADDLQLTVDQGDSVSFEGVSGGPVQIQGRVVGTLTEEVRGLRTVRAARVAPLRGILESVGRGEAFAASNPLCLIVRSAPQPQLSPISELTQSQLSPRRIATPISAPRSIHWFDDQRIAVAPPLQIVNPEGRIVDKFDGGAGYVHVGGRSLIAVLDYPHAAVVNLATRERQRVEVDKLAGGRLLEWSPDARILAVGGTNVLKLFDASLQPIGEDFQVGGKMGVSALSFSSPDTLYVGLVNGEFWCLLYPFRVPEIVTKRQSVPIGLRTSADRGSVACLWQDGLLEVWRSKGAAASIQLRGSDSWSSEGPKLCWLSPSVICCLDGRSGILVLCDLASNSAAYCRLERPALCLDVDPAGTMVAVGMAESNKTDAFLFLFDASVLTCVLAETAPARPEGTTLSSHRYTADWQILLDYLDAVEHGEQPSGTLALLMPVIDSRITALELGLERQRAEIAPIIYRDFAKTLRESKRAAQTLIKDLEWLAKRMLQRGEQENYIVTALDSVLSVEVNRILGKLGDSPPIEHRRAFTQHVLGIPEHDLLYLGFNTDDERDVSAYIPIEFLLDLRHLIHTGEEFGGADPTASPRRKLMAACQRVRDFDLAFSLYEKKALWYSYVLPYSLRDGRERVIDNPHHVQIFGFV